MTAYEERLCPRCGHPAGDHRFWPSCGLTIDSSSEVSLRAEPEPGGVSDETVQAREALSSGQAAAIEANGLCDEIPGQTFAAPVSGSDSDRPPAEDTTAEVVAAPPEPLEVPVRYDARPVTQHDGWRSVVRLWIARRSRSQRVAFVCLVGVIGLAAFLTGRDSRRYV